MRWWLLILVTVSLRAQEDPDSSAAHLLREKISSDSVRIFRYTPVIPYLKLENRNSFFQFIPVNLFGLMAGATFKEKHVVSAGYYILDPRILNDYFILDNVVGSITSLGIVNFSWQYIAINKKPFQLNIASEAGVGHFNIPVYTYLPNTSFRERGELLAFGLGVQPTFKVTRWAGVAALIGYRHVIGEHQFIKLAGWYFSVGLWLDLRDYTNKLRFKARKAWLIRQHFNKNSHE
jgi:hypothetical protein